MPKKAKADKTGKGGDKKKELHAPCCPPLKMSQSVEYVSASKRCTMSFGKEVEDPESDLSYIISQVTPSLEQRVRKLNRGTCDASGTIHRKAGSESIKIVRDPRNRMLNMSVNDCVNIMITLEKTGTWKTMVNTKTRGSLKLEDMDIKDMVKAILSVV